MQSASALQLLLTAFLVLMSVCESHVACQAQLTNIGSPTPPYPSCIALKQMEAKEAQP